MRSGVIAQKVGMTRVFTAAGEHIPVTVLKLDNVQVVAHRTAEKNGYTALQLGAGSRKPSRTSKSERENFARVSIEPKRRLMEFRVSPDNLIDVGAQITAATPELAMYGFAVFYALCLVLNWWFYLRANAYVKNP